MTLDEIARLLPNGFHDAQLMTVKIDYCRHELCLGMKIWVGNLATSSGDVHEIYRAAVVTLSGLLFCVIEPPDPQYPYREADALTIDAGSITSLPTPAAAPLPSESHKDSFTNWIFVQEWNAFLYVSATGASLAWDDGSDVADA